MIEMLPAMQTTRVRTVDFMQPSTDQPQALAPAFAVKNLSMWYGAKEAIKNVTIDIPAKRVTAIIGPSGCGKSTFLRCLNRLHELVPRARVEGEVLFAGANLYAPNIDPAVIRRSIGMVFQKSNPFPTMSIADNVLVGLKLNGVRDRKLLNERLEKSLRMAALWSEVKDDLRKPGISLSGGQQQRLCIARAIAIDDAREQQLAGIGRDDLQRLLLGIQRHGVEAAGRHPEGAIEAASELGCLALEPVGGFGIVEGA